jgi:hypothetical protein
MSLLVIDEAERTHGCLSVVLEASPKGRPVYEGLGFEAVKEPHGGMFVSISQAVPEASRGWRLLFGCVEGYLRAAGGPNPWPALIVVVAGGLAVVYYFIL